MAEAIKNRPQPDEKLESAQSDLMTTARERYQKGVDDEQENRDDALEDLEFLAGEQWPEEIRRERIEDGRPILTINRLPQYVRQVTGDIRQNRPSIKVRPADDVSDDKLADVFSGLIRHIEAASDAGIAYHTAAEGAAQCGLGHFRITTEYSAFDTFEQNIRIRRIKDHFGVVWDPQAAELTKEDARYCFVEESLDIETFRARYPDADLTGFDFQDQATYAYLGDWITHETIRVAEYWTKELKPKTLALLGDGRTIFATKDDVLAESVISEDKVVTPIMKTRKVMVPEIEMRIINGVEVLEGPFKWPGHIIPIIPVVGEEIHIGRKTVRFGVVRHAKDPQRMYNYQRSAQTEQIALQPKSPYTVTATNIAGYEDIWKQANTRNIPYLPYKPDKENNGAPPQRNAPPFRSEGIAAEIALAAEDMKATTGIYDAGLGARSNETSGKAILARQRESDVGTYTYSDNLARAIRHAGRILIEIIPKIYDTERVVRILNEDESGETIAINQRVEDVDGATRVVNDISVGKYDVTVITGPSYSTKRMEAADGMIQLLQSVPEVGKVILDLVVRNLDWPGADEIAERLRKMLPPGLAEPRDDDEEEAAKAQPPPPTPEQIKMQADIEADQREQDRKDAETAADVAATEAKTEGQQLENMEKQLTLAMQSEEIRTLIEAHVADALVRLTEGDDESEAVPAVPNMPATGAPVMGTGAGGQPTIPLPPGAVPPNQETGI